MVQFGGELLWFVVPTHMKPVNNALHQNVYCSAFWGNLMSTLTVGLYMFPVVEISAGSNPSIRAARGFATVLTADLTYHF